MNFRICGAAWVGSAVGTAAEYIAGSLPVGALPLAGLNGALCGVGLFPFFFKGRFGTLSLLLSSIGAGMSGIGSGPLRGTWACTSVVIAFQWIDLLLARKRAAGILRRTRVPTRLEKKVE